MKQVRKYPQEFKQEAVQLALKSPSIVQAAKSLGIPERLMLKTLKMREKK